MVDVIELSARVLRRLGVAAVEDEEAPPLTVTVSPADIATRALQGLGMITPAAERPTIGTAAPAAIAARALQNLGVVVPEGDRPANVATVTVTEIAARALQGLGVPVPASAWPTSSVVVTIAAVATAALGRLGVISADELPTTSDQALAETMGNQLHDNLARLGLVSWTPFTIPQGAAQDYSLLLALQLGTSFGVPVDPSRREAIEARIGMASLVQRAQALIEARVTAIHAGLVAAGLASYANTAIPASIAEPYVSLAMNDVAPVFGKQSDPGRIPVFEGLIRRDALIRRAQSDAIALVSNVHARLVALGIADWNAFAIPASVAEDYAELIANNYRPLFGAPQDRSGEPIIEARIRHMALVRRSQALAETRVAVVHDTLVAQGSASWQVTAIPQAVADEYAGLVAQSVAPSLGQQMDGKVIAALEARVRRAALMARGPQMAEEALRSVHADLAARGKARWTLRDIPAAAERPYMMLAAFHLAPSFGLPQNQGDVAMATIDLNRLISLPSSGEHVRVEYF